MLAAGRGHISDLQLGPPLLPTILLIFVSIGLLSPYIGRKYAGTISVIKFTIPFVYFTKTDTLIWTIGDDVNYYLTSEKLLQNLSALEIYSITAPELISNIIGSTHSLYYWYNIIIMDVFGSSYAVPVLGNVFVTTLSGILFYHILFEIKQNRAYAKYGTIFYLLHWDVLSWSSFLNIKDILVIFFTMICLLSVLKIARENDTSTTKLHSMILVIITAMFWYLRFYAPAFIFGAAILWFISRDKTHSFFAGGLLVISLPILQVGLASASNYVNIGFIWPGILTFSTPVIPFQLTSATHGFLILSATLNWIFYLPTVLVGIRLFFTSDRGRLLLIYLLLVLLFYSVVPYLSGSRQRFQTVFVFAWLEYHFLWMYFPRLKMEYRS
ncbi:hypothetical protein ACFQMA_10850 [Halosimplex aquaticum]|uniref:Glycosyltransferase RgtA/B/C/D-like domain-containing protein n=1 Tax=Halosimplex aquaticum TaxID=3026162 RepID=A0ABD5XYV9_9EURY|nr:hypothetical protein [Halosimplex aquaticum]